MPFSLSLSGGGCRAAAHIGVLKALEEHSLSPIAVSGTSAGAIVAALWALGYSAEELLYISHNIAKSGGSLLDIDTFKIIYTALSLPARQRSSLSGILRGKKLYALLKKLCKGADISEVTLPLFIAATDLISGKTVCYSNSPQKRRLPNTIWKAKIPLCDAVYSSCCLPAVFSPLKTPNQTLVDGGVTDNLPVDLLFAADMPNIIAIDVSNFQSDDSIEGLFETAYRSISVMSKKLNDCYVRGERLNIKPNLPKNAGVFSFDMMDSCYTAGYNAANELIPLIKEF